MMSFCPNPHCFTKQLGFQVGQIIIRAFKALFQGCNNVKTSGSSVTSPGCDVYHDFFFQKDKEGLGKKSVFINQ